MEVDPVVIVGAGIAGLGAAVALRAQGIPVIVYERDESEVARKQGYGMTLQATTAMESLGILKDVRAADTASHEHWTFRPSGEVIGYFGNAYRAQGAGAERGNIRVPRDRLRGFLMAQLPPGTVRWGATLQRYAEAADGAGLDVQVARADGSSETVRACVLVGADGIHSAVRRAMGGSAPAYLGVLLFLGISRTRHWLLDGRGFYTIDGSRRLFTMPFADEAHGSAEPLTMWQLSMAVGSEAEARAAVAGGPAALLERARAATAGWHEPVSELLAGTILEGPLCVWGTPLYDFGEQEPRIPGRPRKGEPPATDKAALRVTLIGDAAHPMSPFKGQGANQALQDGPALATWLAKALLEPPAEAAVAADGGVAASHPARKPRRLKVQSALQSFEREMMTRAGAKVLASRHAAGFLHSPAVLAEPCKLAGVNDSHVTEVLAIAAARGVTAACGSDLVRRLGEAIEEQAARVRALSALTPAPTPAASGEDPSASRATLLYYCYLDLRGGLQQEVAAWYERVCRARGVLGRVRVARDGVNATLGGSRGALEGHQEDIRSHPLLGAQLIDFKLTPSAGPRSDEAVAGCCFDTFVAKLCKEVVTMNLPQPDREGGEEAEEDAGQEGQAAPLYTRAHPANTGLHLSPAEYHKALCGGDPEAGIPAADVIIDVRNGYESDVGRFVLPADSRVKLLAPRVRTFDKFPAWFDAHEAEMAGKNVLMYCTGGVRCERASAYVREKGEAFKSVFQLRGGVQRYMEAAAAGQLTGPSLFMGKMFVFDERPGVDAPTGVAADATTAPPSTTEGGSGSGSSSSGPVLGHCVQCSAPWDVYRWLRCGKCGVLVLVCDACVAAGGGPEAVSAAACLRCVECSAGSAGSTAAATATATM